MLNSSYLHRNLIREALYISIDTNIDTNIDNNIDNNIDTNIDNNISITLILYIYLSFFYISRFGDAPCSVRVFTRRV
jgi:hypothetical protein